MSDGINGKDRLRIEWIGAHGGPQAQIFVNVREVRVAESMVFVVLRPETLAFGVPIARLVRFAKLKDTEEGTNGDEKNCEAGEPAEDA